jgi:hypothetical protein
MLHMMEEIPGRITEIISDGVETGIFRKEDPEALSGTIFALLSGALSTTEIRALDKLSSDRKVKLITDIILKGIKA